MDHTRRSFLEQVGQGVLLAGVGSQISGELGLGHASAAEGPTRLNFGKLEPLVDTLQTTAPAKLAGMTRAERAAAETLATDAIATTS